MCTPSSGYEEWFTVVGANRLGSQWQNSAVRARLYPKVQDLHMPEVPPVHSRSLNANEAFQNCNKLRNWAEIIFRLLSPSVQFSRSTRENENWSFFWFPSSHKCCENKSWLEYTPTRCDVLNILYYICCHLPFLINERSFLKRHFVDVYLAVSWQHDFSSGPYASRCWTWAVLHIPDQRNSLRSQWRE